MKIVCLVFLAIGLATLMSGTGYVAPSDSTSQKGHSKAVSHAPPPTAVHSGTSSLSVVRHRGPNPAVIGGSARFDPRKAGAIDGTHINRRP